MCFSKCACKITLRNGIQTVCLGPGVCIHLLVFLPVFRSLMNTDHHYARYQELPQTHHWSWLCSLNHHQLLTHSSKISSKHYKTDEQKCKQRIQSPKVNMKITTLNVTQSHTRLTRQSSWCRECEGPWSYHSSSYLWRNCSSLRCSLVCLICFNRSCRFSFRMRNMWWSNTT